jgi:hypothetical protein
LRHLGITIEWAEEFPLFFLQPMFAMLGTTSDLDHLSEGAKLRGEEAIWGIWHSLKASLAKIAAKEVMSVLGFGVGLKAVDYLWGIMWQTDEKHDFFKV